MDTGIRGYLRILPWAAVGVVLVEVLALPFASVVGGWIAGASCPDPEVPGMDTQACLHVASFLLVRTAIAGGALVAAIGTSGPLPQLRGVIWGTIAASVSVVGFLGLASAAFLPTLLALFFFPPAVALPPAIVAIGGTLITLIAASASRGADHPVRSAWRGFRRRWIVATLAVAGPAACIVGVHWLVVFASVWRTTPVPAHLPLSTAVTGSLVLVLLAPAFVLTVRWVHDRG